MGKYMKKCKATGEVAVMEVAHHPHHQHRHQHVGVRTRARTLAMAGTSTTVAKKRKMNNTSSTNSAELQFSSSCSFIQLRSRKLLITSENSTNSESKNSIAARVIPTNSCSSNPGSNHVRTASRCSSNGSSMLANEMNLFSSSAVDLEGEGIEIENSTYSNNCRERRESTPLSNLQAESGDLESTDRLPTMSNSRNHRSEEINKMMMMPSEEELEDFFSVAEKAEQKRFSERYNFDIVKEVPLEGRYEWVRLTQ